MANQPEHTNVSRLIDRVRATAREASDAMNKMRALEAEATRVGGEERTNPYFYTLDEKPLERQDLGFSLKDLNMCLSAFKVLSAGADNGLAGLAAQIDAQWAAIDKIKV
jgi:hypothetical protein